MDLSAQHTARFAATANGTAGQIATILLNATGPYRLHAYADDRDGHATLLGTRTITCSNATAIWPFGAIDTPEKGATVSGSAYVNFGWALTSQGIGSRYFTVQNPPQIFGPLRRPSLTGIRRLPRTGARTWRISGARLRFPGHVPCLRRPALRGEDAMTATKQTAQTCRWADPAIYLAFQDWTAIWNSSWRCVRGATPRPLASSTECENCPHWEQRAPADVAWTIAAVGL